MLFHKTFESIVKPPLAKKGLVEKMRASRCCFVLEWQRFWKFCQLGNLFHTIIIGTTKHSELEPLKDSGMVVLYNELSWSCPAGPGRSLKMCPNTVSSFVFFDKKTAAGG